MIQDFFRHQGIKVLWRLQFMGYLRTLSLKFQKARTKIEVVLTLPYWLSHLDTKLGETPKVHITVRSVYCTKQNIFVSINTLWMLRPWHNFFAVGKIRSSGGCLTETISIVSVRPLYLARNKYHKNRSNLENMATSHSTTRSQHFSEVILAFYDLFFNHFQSMIVWK